MENTVEVSYSDYLYLDAIKHLLELSNDQDRIYELLCSEIGRTGALILEHEIIFLGDEPCMMVHFVQEGNEGVAFLHFLGSGKPHQPRNHSA